MKEIYKTKITNDGGRFGQVYDDSKEFDFKIVPPGSKDKGTNPEQLFAAAYSSCFNGALSLILKTERIQGKSTVSATVTLNEGEKFDYQIAALIEGHIEGLSKEETEKYLKKAHEVCPYSKAIKNNVKVEIVAI